MLIKGITTRHKLKCFFVVYQYCEHRMIKHPFNHETKKARKDWLTGYRKRHPDISLRIPEPTSIQRAVGFNRAKVDRYLQLLETTLLDGDGKTVISEGNVFKVNESGFTICHKPKKVLSRKGKRTYEQ